MIWVEQTFLKGIFLTAVALLYCPALLSQPGIYKTHTGVIQFISNAPLERIEAKSVALRGALDIANRHFAFSVPIASFKGFNSALQRVHFRANIPSGPKVNYISMASRQNEL
jgi:hypothetical protein